jgi:putative DNA primase/helicase
VASRIRLADFKTEEPTIVTFENFLERLKNVKRSGAKATARCPAHTDDDNSLSVAKGEKGIVLKCFAGCSIESICAALSLEVKELFPPRDIEARKKLEASPKPVTLAELAAAKQLPEQWLREQGVQDFRPDYPRGPGVAIAYYNEDGSQHARLRRRTSLGKDGWSWAGPTGVALIPYGIWRLKEWRSGELPNHSRG